MNKLLFPSGGVFLHGEDFEYSIAGIVEAIKATTSIVAGENKIISGCNISYDNGVASITEGYVLIGGEICFCAAQNINTQSLSNASLKLVETYDPDGLEVLADSVSRNTYAIRRAVASDGLNNGDEIILSNPVYYYYQKTFQNSELNANWAVSGSYSLKATLFAGHVTWQGRITGEVSSSDIFTSNSLPSVFVPTVIRSLPTQGLQQMVSVSFFNSALGGRVLTTDLAGQQIDFSGGQELVFDGLSYAI